MGGGGVVQVGSIRCRASNQLQVAEIKGRGSKTKSVTREQTDFKIKQEAQFQPSFRQSKL